MTIDEAIEYQRGMAENYKYRLALNETGNPMFSLGNREIPRIEKYVEEYEQVAKWLEELKAYKTCNEGKFIHYKESAAYNKAIDDFCETMDNELFSNEWVKIIYHTIAEKLKAGGKNEIDRCR